MRVLLASIVLAGCAGTQEPPDLPSQPCASDELALDVAPPAGDFGDLDSGGDLWCGNPPQGGAPYSPFRVRLSGPEVFEDGLWMEMIATDRADGSELAYTDLTMGLTCANVGESAGLWVGSEAHMRYYGFTLEELDGRDVDLTIRVEALGADPVQIEEHWQVALTLL